MSKKKPIKEQDVKRIKKAIDKKTKNDKGDDLFIERVDRAVKKKIQPKKNK